MKFAFIKGCALISLLDTPPWAERLSKWASHIIVKMVWIKTNQEEKKNLSCEYTGCSEKPVYKLVGITKVIFAYYCEEHAQVVSDIFCRTVSLKYLETLEIRKRIWENSGYPEDYLESIKNDPNLTDAQKKFIGDIK